MYTIREFKYTLTDYLAASDLIGATGSDSHNHTEDIIFMDELRSHDTPFARYIAESDGKVIAEATYGQSIWLQEPGKIILNITVHLEDHNIDLYGEMYDHLVTEASIHQPKGFSVRVFVFGKIKVSYELKMRNVLYLVSSNFLAGSSWKKHVTNTSLDP